MGDLTLATHSKSLSKREAAIVQQLKDQLALGRTLQEAKLRFADLFEQSEIEAAAENLKQTDERFKNAAELSTLHDQPNFSGWYGGPNEDSTSVWSGLKQTLRRKSWSDAMIENLDHASTGVIEQLAPPRSEKAMRVKGLVLGHVQSGKTANYSAVIAKAVDSGYKLVIVLAGMHNNLRKQTQERLKSELVDPNPAGCTTLTSVDELGDFQKKQNVVASRALSVDGFTLVVLKKNSSVLRNFHAWLAGASSDVIGRIPVLIIDDESDQASINTSKPEDDPTAINNHIRKLMTSFRVCSYVGYTATPFANVLVDASVENDVFPRDFLISLGKPPSYFGAEELFGRDKVGALKAREGIRVIRIIPPEDEAVLTPSQQKKKEMAKKETVPSFLTPSILAALDSFVVGCAARVLRGQHKKHMTMLLHVSHLNDVQARLKEEVDETLTAMKFAAEQESPELIGRLRNLWDGDFSQVTKDFEGAESCDFGKVWKYCKRVIGEIDSVLENSKSLERLSFEGDNPLRTVVIGGNTLSRGLTLEGLTTSYFVRTSKAYDTLLQMGRWFGYRPGYIDLTRIFVTEDLRDYFYHLATVEQEVRDEIKVMAANGERPIEVGVRIRNHPHMTVTSSNKMRRAQDCAFTYSGAKVQARHVITQNKEAVEKNYQVVRELFSRCKKFGKREVSCIQDFRNALLFRNLSHEVVLQFLDEYLFSPENGKFTNDLFKEYISKQVSVGEVKDWSIAFLSSQDGLEVDLGGDSVRVYDRSVLRRAFQESRSDSDQLRALATPGDELIDLTDMFDREVSKVEDLLPPGRERESEIGLRRRFRPPERPLLIVHPLNWKQLPEAEKKFSMSEPLSARGPVFGITFVFPFSKKDQSRFGFISNSSINAGRPIQVTDVVSAPALKTEPQTIPLISPKPIDDASLRRLSKSQYVRGRKCLKRVWLYNHRKDLADSPDEMQTLLFAQGNQIGRLAQEYFPGGHLIHEDHTQADRAISHTRAAIEDPKVAVLFEAAFVFENVLIRVDVIRKCPDGSIELVEVKSSSSVKKEHLDDVAVQKFVLEGLGFNVRASFLMHLNSEYVLGEKLNLQDLFVLKPMDDEIENCLAEVPVFLKLIRSKLAEEVEPEGNLGSVCKSPYPCEFKGYCWKDVGEESIHNLVRITDKKRAELLDLGVKQVSDVPDSFELSESQAVQVRVAKSGKAHMERENIRQYLSGLAWPLHFLDFETIPYAVPKFSKSSPYQQIPFQFSLHIQKERGEPLAHVEFLHRENSDPRRSFAEALLRSIDGDGGSIVVYHSSFERAITGALGQIVPEYSEAFGEIVARMWDLEVPFAKRWYCSPEFVGSSSIKSVLPALVPGLSYKSLKIQKGDVAQKKYGELVQMPAGKDAESIARALLEYCKLDTLAMYEILQKLEQLCS